MAVPIRYPEPGSRVLREWNATRARERLIAQRQRQTMMRTDAFAGVLGVGGGGFAGAGINRLTASLGQWSRSVNADLDAGLVILRARARDLCQNNEFGRRFLSLVESNVIGPGGPTLQVRASLTNGGLDKVANDTIETAFARWSQRADLRGLMDLAHVQRVGITSVARDGEALIRIVRNRDLPNGIALQLLEADRLDENLNTTLSNGNAIRQGVEINSLLQPVAYWIKTSHPGENYQSTPAQAERVPAANVIHPFLLTRAEQVRGYTWMHAVLLRMQMLHAYEEAAVVAARVGAAKMGVFTRKDDSEQALASMATGTASDGKLQMSAEAGEFMELPAGYELHNWDPEYPHANFDSFLKACFRGVASGLNLATHNLTGDMTEVNFSSARIAELAERDHWKMLQAWWIRTVSFPIFRAWLESALIRGEIRLPSGAALPADRLEKFSDAARFQGRRWQWVDPAKEIEAAEREIAAGLNSRTAIAASQGRELEDIIDELGQEKVLLEAAGLPSNVGRVASQPSSPVPEPGFGKAADAAPAPIHVNVDARSTIHVPEREVHLEALVEAPQVHINTHPASAAAPDRAADH